LGERTVPNAAVNTMIPQHVRVLHVMRF